MVTTSHTKSIQSHRCLAQHKIRTASISSDGPHTAKGTWRRLHLTHGTEGERPWCVIIVRPQHTHTWGSFDSLPLILIQHVPPVFCPTSKTIQITRNLSFSLSGWWFGVLVASDVCANIFGTLGSWEAQHIPVFLSVPCSGSCGLGGSSLSFLVSLIYLPCNTRWKHQIFFDSSGFV